jgi:hypothetical protein
MQAEDIHVANLLTQSERGHFHDSPQYAYGNEGVYQEGHYLLVGGLETPRTHHLGHAIVLGNTSKIMYAKDYILYHLFFEEAHRQGGLSGYAHFGVLQGAQDGIAVTLPVGLLSFLEVLQFGKGIYEVWYAILNTGFRMSPLAGTDYPFTPGTPGRDRFYTRVEGPLTLQGWLEGIRQGKTFVTNGSILDFTINDKGLGEEIILDAPGSVQLSGSVRFDPSQDIITQLEVVENGEVVHSVTRSGNASEIRFSIDHTLSESAWIALRAEGDKQGEPASRSVRITERGPAPGPLGPPESLAHSAPIYVSIKNAPSVAEHPRAQKLAQEWIDRLDALEARLADDKIEVLAKDEADWVTIEILRHSRPALLEAIEQARTHFKKQVGGSE